MTRTKNIVKCEICGKDFHASGLNGHLYQKHGIRKAKVPKEKLALSEPPKVEPVKDAAAQPGQPEVKTLEELFKEEITNPAPLVPDHPAFRASGPDAIPDGPMSTVVGPEFPPQPAGGFAIVGWGQLYSMIAEILNSIGNQLHDREPTMPWMPIPMNTSIARQLGDQTSACVGPVDPKKALMGSIMLCFGPAAICIIAMLLGPKTFTKVQAKFAAFVDKKLGQVKSDGKPGGNPV